MVENLYFLMLLGYQALPSDLKPFFISFNQFNFKICLLSCIALVGLTFRSH